MKNRLCFTTPTLDQKTIALLKGISETGFMFHTPANAFETSVSFNGFLKKQVIDRDGGAPRSTVIVTDQALEAIKAFNTDPSTGREFGDHGTADQAVRFCLDWDFSHREIGEFIKAWSEGNLSDWGRYYAWLRTQGS